MIMEREEYTRLSEEMNLLKERLAGKDQEIEDLKRLISFWKQYSMGSAKRSWCSIVILISMM